MDQGRRRNKKTEETWKQRVWQAQANWASNGSFPRTILVLSEMGKNRAALSMSKNKPAGIDKMPAPQQAWELARWGHLDIYPSTISTCLLPSWRCPLENRVFMGCSTRRRYHTPQLSVSFLATWALPTESLNPSTKSKASPIYCSDRSQLVRKRQFGNTKNPFTHAIKSLEKKKDSFVQGREKQRTHLESFLKASSWMIFFFLLPGYWLLTKRICFCK